MPSRFTNRELSILDFQDRVLALAEDPAQPILERVRFVSIVASNLDEFFQVRVAGLTDLLATDAAATTPDGMTAREQLAAVRDRVASLDRRMHRLLESEIRPVLEAHGVLVADWPSLDEPQRKAMVELFETHIYPILTPIAVDPMRPFPYISNLSLNLAVVIETPSGDGREFARVKVPPLLPRYLPFDDGSGFVPADQVIGAQIGALFPGRVVIGAHPFRVTRSAEQAVRDDAAGDLLAAMEELLETRHRFSRVVRLEVDEAMPLDLLDLLTLRMGIRGEDVYVEAGPLALAGIATVAAVERPDLMHEPVTAATQPALVPRSPGKSFFDRLRRRDVLIHLPYESFATSVGAFIDAASNDPAVVALKQTLYRTSDPGDPAAGGERSIVHSLIAAARSGKQVVVLVELKARFDEQANIAWARILEEAGVHVVYGIAGLKTHAKLALVVRREGDSLVRYSHIGTGNYNPKTAGMYEDLGLLTADPDLGSDLSELFNVLTGLGLQRRYRKLLVAPVTLRDAMTERIREQANLGAEGLITMKVNHLVDPAIIDELYAASARATPVDLIVRGTCCLRPGVPGLSDTITVRSIVGRYLEHSRVYRFGRGDQGEYLIGSADLMPRNLDGRVEAIVPIEDRRLRRRLEELLQVCLADDILAWQLVDDRWQKVPTVIGLDAHVRFRSLVRGRSLGAHPGPAEPSEPPT